MFYAPAMVLSIPPFLVHHIGEENMPYNVYVIELDKKVLQSRKFRKRNPHMNPKLVCYYVGQTSHDPNTRFKQHRIGYKSNRFVKKYGLRLKPRKFKKYNPIETREEAENIERHLANKLRAKGHGVWSN
jgi:predicted GIY-YIG superfamily endonuclease